MLKYTLTVVVSAPISSTFDTLAYVLLERRAGNDVDEVGLEHLCLHAYRIDNAAAADSELLRHHFLYLGIGIDDTVVGVAHLVDGLVGKEFEAVELQEYTIVY